MSYIYLKALALKNVVFASRFFFFNVFETQHPRLDSFCVPLFISFNECSRPCRRKVMGEKGGNSGNREVWEPLGKGENTLVNVHCPTILPLCISE